MHMDIHGDVGWAEYRTDHDRIIEAMGGSKV